MSHHEVSPLDLREFIKRNPRLSAAEVSGRLNVPEIAVMRAMAGEAVEVPPADLDRLLGRIRPWGEVLSLVRNRDAVSELKFQAGSLDRSGDWINAITPAYNLHIRIAATRAIWLLVRPNHKRNGTTCSVNFANEAGEVFWRIYAQSETARAGFSDLIEIYRESENAA